MRPIRWCFLLLTITSACAPGRQRPGEGGDDAPSEVDAAIPAVCGDGILQAPETCDPASSCLTTCPPMACQTASMAGSPATCDVVCGYATLMACIPGDGCCPSPCNAASDPDCAGIRIDDYYRSQYSLLDLGPAAGVPRLYGGLTVHATDPGKLIIGGDANTEAGALYEIGIVRDAQKHIVGFSGTAVRVADGAYNDGSILHGPGGVTFLTRWPVNEMGLMKPGSVVTDKVISLGPMGVAQSVASAAFTPPGVELGGIKLVSWSGGEWYSAAYAPDPTGTFDILAPQHKLTLPGGPEGIVYVPSGSPLFPTPSLLVSEFTAGEVATYEVDNQGDPNLGTRRRIVLNLDGAEGATIDPKSGDFLFSTFGGGDRIIVVRGFSPIE